MKMTKANNYGKGFWIEYTDGHVEWVLGQSAQEKKIAEMNHGKIKRKVGAR